MEKKGKTIIGVVLVIITLIFIGLLILGSADLTLQTSNAQVTVPNNYTLDNDGVASCGDINILFTPIMGVTKDSEMKVYNALKSNGKDAGYENITNRTINGFDVFEFAAHPDDLKNFSSDEVYNADGSYSWNTYSPNLPYQGITSLKVDHFRLVSFMKGDKVNYLTIFTDNPKASLYTPEIENVINSIADV